MEGEGETCFFMCKVDMSLKAQETRHLEFLGAAQQALANSCIIGIIFIDGFAGRSMAFGTSYYSSDLTLNSEHTEHKMNIGTLAHA